MSVCKSDCSQAEAATAPRNQGAGFALCAILGGCMACVLLGAGFWMGHRSTPPSLPPELLQATATHGGSNMAVCTARIDEEADGFFALDYITGDLKGWVFNPRSGSFGGMFATNISEFLGPPGKNAEYLLVSGSMQPPASGSTVRYAGMVLYVVDVRGGQFAAFTVPWDRSMRNTGATQTNLLQPVGGDVIRLPVGPGAAARKPGAGNANQGNANNAAKGDDPNANGADANVPNAPAKNANPPKNNPNNNKK